MSNALELKVLFTAVDKFVRPVKAITGAAKEASQALKLSSDRVKELNGTVSKIDAFKKVERDAAITANTIKSTETKIAALRDEISKTGVPTKEMASELERLTEKSAKLAATASRLKNSEIDLRTTLQLAGIDTKNLAAAREQLVAASSSELMVSRKLQAALDAENQKMRRLHAAQADLKKSKEAAGKMAVAGAGIMAGGAAVALPTGKAAKDFADFETAMLGVARQMDGAKDDAGKMTALYWEMAAAIKALSEQPQIGKTANDIAKIVEGGARMGIQGKQNLLIYAETTAVMANAFDLPVEKIGEDIGKISQLYKVPIKDIKTLGDTINYLDDNALAKGGDIIDVMKRIAGTADMAKMSFKEAAALGSTFLSLGANSEVAASASNAMIRELAIANMQSKRFKGGMDMLGLNGQAIQTSMSKDATGTIIKVLEAIKALPEQKQLEAATRLFGKEYGDDAAKLASNLDEYRRQLKLVNDEKARGSMQRESDTRGDTLNARMDAAKNAMTNLSTDLGKHLKPALVETMEKTLAIVQSIRAWAAENPALSSGIMTVVKGLAITLTVVGALAIAAGAILVPLSAMNFWLVSASAAGSGFATTVLSIGAKVWSVISPIGKVVAAFSLGYGAGMLLATGIDWALSKILGYETTLGSSTYDLVQAVKSGFGSLLNWFITLPERMVASGLAIGKAIVDGIWTGLSSGWAWLVQKISDLAALLPEAVKAVLGIHSPSRVFAEIGSHTMAGLEQGLTGSEDGPLRAAAGVARKLAGIGAGMAIGGSAMAGSGIDGGLQQSGAGGGNTYQINITAPAGSDGQNIAALVAREIERIESQKAARQRSRLRDTE